MDPARERWCFIVNEDAAKSDTGLGLDRDYRERIDLGVRLGRDISPPVPSGFGG